MKKALSVLLSLIMVLGTCNALIIPSVAVTEDSSSVGASVAEGTLAAWDFNDSSLSGITDHELLREIGWTDLSGTGSLNASVSNGALRLRNSAYGNYYLQVLENTDLTDSFTIEYDFLYSAQSNLPENVYKSGVTYTKYNTVQDSFGGFLGNNGTSNIGTWLAQPRLNGYLLNAPQGASGWIQEEEGAGVGYKDYVSLNGGVGSTGSVKPQALNVWFRMKIEYSPDHKITASIRLRDGVTWVIDSYSAYESATASSDSMDFVSKYLRFNVSSCVDIHIDNLRIYDTMPVGWDFDDPAISGLTNENLLRAIGWTDLRKAGSLTAELVDMDMEDNSTDYALRLRNSAYNNYYLQVLESGNLKESFTIQYDFMYAAPSALPTPVSGGGKTYDSYNSVPDSFGGFLGNNDLGNARTWLVQPRLNGVLLNAPQAATWIDTTSSPYSSVYEGTIPVGGTTATNTIYGKWFSVKIEYSPDCVVTASLRARDDETWTIVDTYTDTETSEAMSSSTAFVTKYLRFNVSCCADIYLDNISIRSSFPKSWSFDDVSLTESSTSSDVLKAIGWVDLSETDAMTASIEDGTLRLKNSSDAEHYFLQVACGKELNQPYILEYDLKYATQNDLPEEAKATNTTFNQYYNSDMDEAGGFLGGNGATQSQTWNVQPRLNGALLNAPKSNAWYPGYAYNGGDEGPIALTREIWYTVKIEYSPSGIVTASIKEREGAEWYTHSYTSDQKNAAATCTNFVSGYISFDIGKCVDVSLDNISIYTAEYYMDFSGFTGTHASLIPELGWSLEDGEATGFNASAAEGALHVKNYSNTANYFRVLDSERLKGAYVLQYDFKYPSNTPLPASLQSSYQYTKSDGTIGYYTTYNARTDQSGSFVGGSGTTPAGTWNVQPRINGKLLNGPKTDVNSWVTNVESGTSFYSTFESNSGNVRDTWYNVKIEYFPGSMVRVLMKAQGDTDWIVTDEYCSKEMIASVGTQQFISSLLRFTVGPLVDVYIDNLSLIPLDYLPETYKIQYGEAYQILDENGKTEDVFDMQMIATVLDDEAEEVGFIVIQQHYDETDGIFKQNYVKKPGDGVYPSISYENENGESISIVASEVRGGMSGVFSATLSELSLQDTYMYHVIPYEVRDGETLYGTPESFDRSIPKEVLPAYDTSTGSDTGFIEFSAGGYYTKQIVGTSLAEYNAYITKLIHNGFILYQSRDQVNGNYFRTLYNDVMMAHVYYMPAANTGGDFTKNVARIVVSDKQSWVAYNTSAEVMDESNPEVTVASAALMDVNFSAQNAELGSNSANGLGMVFTNPDGSYVIMDGAWHFDTTDLYNYMKQNNKREDGKILIRAWIITHPHQDHWGNIVEFAARYASHVGYDGKVYDYSDVIVENLVVQLSQQYCCNNAQTYTGSEKIRQAAAKLGAGTIVPQTGQIMYFGQMEVEFLYTLETMLTASNVNEYLQTGTSGIDGNEQSLMFRARFDGGTKTVLVTGDATENESAHMEAMYSTYLRSDIITLPHHGIDPTTNTFYDVSVQAQYVLYSTNEEASWSRYACSYIGADTATDPDHWGTIENGGCAAVHYAWSIGGERFSADENNVYSYLNGYTHSYVIFYIGAGLIPLENDAIQRDCSSYSSLSFN